VIKITEHCAVVFLCLDVTYYFFYTGARELARDARATTPSDPMNSVVGGLASGAVLGRIQGWLLD
jgi:hypothetical protein